MMQNLIVTAFETVTTVEQGVEILDVFMHLSSREVTLVMFSILCLVVCHDFLYSFPLWPVWLNGRSFARDPKGHGFESRPVRFQVTALGKLLTRMCLCYPAV